MEQSLQNFKRILFITAHPDDVECFMGGLAIKFSQIGADCRSLILSGGNNGKWESKYKNLDDKSIIKIRREESLRAAKILGLSSVEFLNFKDRKININIETINQIKEEIVRINPDLVVTFEPKSFLNFYPHPDHINTARITREALIEISNPIPLLAATTIFPSIFIDIRDVYSVKMNAIRIHVSQKRILMLVRPLLIWFPSVLFGCLRKFSIVEGYRKIL